MTFEQHLWILFIATIVLNLFLIISMLFEKITFTWRDAGWLAVGGVWAYLFFSFRYLYLS